MSQMSDFGLVEGLKMICSEIIWSNNFKQKIYYRKLDGVFYFNLLLNYSFQESGEAGTTSYNNIKQIPSKSSSVNALYKVDQYLKYGTPPSILKLCESNQNKLTTSSSCFCK